MWEFSLPAERLLAFQEGLYSMGLTRWICKAIVLQT